MSRDHAQLSICRPSLNYANWSGVPPSSGMTRTGSVRRELQSGQWQTTSGVHAAGAKQRNDLLGAEPVANSTPRRMARVQMANSAFCDCRSRDLVPGTSPGETQSLGYRRNQASRFSPPTRVLSPLPTLTADRDVTVQLRFINFTYRSN